MMHDKLMKMLEKKKARKVSPVEQKAKMGVLKELKDDMSSEMGSSLKDMMGKKVSVMAGSKEDLERGLDKAKELVHSMPGNGEESKSEDMEAGASEMAESSEDVDSEIKMLEEKLAKLKAKKGESEEEEEDEDESMEA